MFRTFDQNLLYQRMRDELTEAGFVELRTPGEVQQALADQSGSTLLMINSVCGCAAGSARPGTVLSLRDDHVPDRLYTVFAGQDKEATAAAREYIHGYPPSSPAVVLFRDGQVVHMLERGDIEGCTAEDVSAKLQNAYARWCA